MLIMPWSEILRRLPRVCWGLVLFGVGVAMMVAADMGLGPMVGYFLPKLTIPEALVSLDGSAAGEAPR